MMIILKNPIPFTQLSFWLSGLLKRPMSSPNGCQLHYHVADSVLTCGWTIISQQIWNRIYIMHAILGIWIKIEKSSAWKWSMYIHLSGWHSSSFGALSCLTVIRWRGWRFGPVRCRSWWRCTRAFEPPACLWIRCCAILARKTAARLILTNQCQVSFHRSLHLDMPGKQNTPLLLFSDFGVRCFDSLLCFLHSGTRKPLFSHFGHIQGKMLVGLFKLYPISMSWHSSWHVENILEISCCIKSEIRLLSQLHMTP